MTIVFFFQAEDGIRDLVRSRGLGDVYKRQEFEGPCYFVLVKVFVNIRSWRYRWKQGETSRRWTCLLYTSDAADERSSVDLGGRRIIKKQNN